MKSAFNQDPVKRALKERCTMNGCIEIGMESCRFCGFNMAENSRRVKAGLFLDESTGLRRFRTTPKEGDNHGNHHADQT